MVQNILKIIACNRNETVVQLYPRETKHYTRIRVFPDPYFRVIRENTGQRKPVFWHILCSVK